MTATVMAALAVAAFLASFISGLFGMAGGLVLLGALLAVVPVAPGMVAFSIIMLSGNGFRSFMWREHILWSVIGRYLVGSVVAILAMRLIAFIPDKATVYICLGLMPFAARILPPGWHLDITRPGQPYVCGVLITVMQLLAGGAGNVLDVFFQRSMLDRKVVVATKSMSQSFTHVLRIGYFSSFPAAWQFTLPWWLFVAMFAVTIAGTQLAGGFLHRMTNEQFRLWSRLIISGFSLVYLARGIWLLAQG